MIRIVHVTESLKQRYGVTSVIMSYYRAINKERVQFDFLVNEAEPQIIDEIQNLGGCVYFFPTLGLTNICSVRNDLRSFFEKHHAEYTAVHSAFTQLEFLIFSEAKRVGILHRISHSHATTYTVGGWVKTLRNWLMHTIGKPYVTDYFSCGDEAGLFLFGPQKIRSPYYYKMRNAIRLDRFPYDVSIRDIIRKQYSWENDYIIGCVGSLSSRKNQIYLVNLLVYIIKRIPNAKLAFVGDGPARNELEKTISKLSISNRCCLLGTSDRVPELLCAFDCFALPSFMEGLPISVVEAQATGLPCILSDNITKEVAITNLCSYCAIGDDKSWVDAFVSAMSIERRDHHDEVREKGYDIMIEAQRLADKYEAMAIDNRN